MRRLLLLLFAVTTLLIGPAAAQSDKMKSERLASVKSIGIVSAIGDDVYFVFATGLFSVDEGIFQPGWGFDRHAEEVFKGILADRYEVRLLDFDHAAVVRAAQSKEARRERKGYEPVLATLRQSLQPRQADLVVVIVPAYQEGTINGAHSQAAFGIGIYNNNARGTRRSGHVFATGRIMVLDGTTLELLAQRSFRDDDGEIPNRKLNSDTAFLQTPDKLPDDDRRPIGAVIRDLYRENIGLALRKLQLIP